MNAFEKEHVKRCLNELEMTELSGQNNKSYVKDSISNIILKFSEETKVLFNSKMSELEPVTDDNVYYDEWKKFMTNELNNTEKPFGDHQANGTEKFMRDFVQLQTQYKEASDLIIKQNRQIEELTQHIKSLSLRTDENIESLNKRIETSTRIKIELESPREFDGTVVIDNATKNQENIIHCINNDVPIYITGPAGCGKSHDAELVARYLKLGEQVTYTGFIDGQAKTIVEEPQYFYPMNAIQQEYQIKGYTDANGYYHPTNFWKAFKFGGLLLLDELDSSIPEVLVILNFAIANHKFEFPDGNGTTIAHPQFRIIATGNTNGQGSNELYTGRYQLDAASLNRFVQMKYDYDIETEISLIADADGKYNEGILNSAHQLREICKIRNLPAIVSYRQIIYVNKLVKSGLDIGTSWSLAFLNSLDEDTAKLVMKDMGWVGK